MSSRVADLANLLTGAGLPVSQVSFRPNPSKVSTSAGYTTAQTADSVTVGVDWSAAPTGGQVSSSVAIINAFSAAARKPRLLIDILTDMNALAAGQKANVNTNVFTTRPYPFETDSGPNAGAILAIVANAGSVAALTTQQKIGIAALYCQDVPKFFVNPSWDTTINVLGDMLA
jgi:hypothetical protein